MQSRQLTIAEIEGFVGEPAKKAKPAVAYSLIYSESRKYGIPIFWSLR